MSDKSPGSVEEEFRVERLPKRADFLRLRSGKRYSCANFVLQGISQSQNSNCRVGFTVTTRNGSAVIRNRIKRRLRAAVSEVFPDKAKPGHDYAVIARRNALTADFATIVQDLKHALDHVHMNRAKGAGKSV
ncbi:MAG: ribonuclease P protein component [Pseudomonadota bacterium]